MALPQLPTMPAAPMGPSTPPGMPGGFVPVGPGVSRSPNVGAQAFLAVLPPNVDPSELPHLQAVADLLAANVNQGNANFMDAMKLMKNVLQSVRTTAQSTAPALPAAAPAGFTPPPGSVNANAVPIPGTGAPQLPVGSLPTPTDPKANASPTGRNFYEIQASGKYQTVGEREWYLNQINRTIGRSGLPVPKPAPSPAEGLFGGGPTPLPNFGAPSTGSGGVLRTSDDGSAVVPDYAHGGEARLTSAQVSAIRTIFPPSEWDMAMEVAAAESHGDDNAVGADGERSIFQIHPVNWKSLGVDEHSLQDPFRAAEAAYKLWQSDGWQPWTTAPLIRAATMRQH